MLPPIDPPLVNSANPWCSTKEDLLALYKCPYIGAVTTRTSLIIGFEHDPAVHQHTFFDPRDHSLVAKDTADYHVAADKCGSLNTLGYSPIPLADYLTYIEDIAASGHRKKPFIISVTGSPSQVLECYERITRCSESISAPLCMEINLSCPNIPDKPPPAYSGPALLEYLNALQTASGHSNTATKVPIGIKSPPYTYADQFKTLIDTLLASAQGAGYCPIDFITATNTLGSCLLIKPDSDPALSSATGAGIGGLAGAPLHPLALGNVKTLRHMLDQHQLLQNVDVIGIGGVSDKAGFDRMRSVGAKVVGVGTALGREGVAVFRTILGSGD